MPVTNRRPSCQHGDSASLATKSTWRLKTYPLSLFMLFGLSQACAQLITRAPTVILPENLQLVAGTCTDYQSALTSSGVQADGAAHPGRCRQTDFEPLFNGDPLTGTWQAFMTGPSHPTYRQMVPSGRPTCLTEYDLSVTLSARLQVSRLNWSNNQSAGMMCTNESTRVNAATIVPTATMQSDVNRFVAKFRQALARSPNITACATGKGRAVQALQLMIWQHLQTLAAAERREWPALERRYDDPGSGSPNKCAPQCQLCSTGWVGTMMCTKTAQEMGTPNFEWFETQNWVFGGPAQQQGSITSYPSTWTANGGGGKTGISWNVDVSAPGTLSVSYPLGVPSFQTSQLTLTGAIISSPPGSNADEAAYQLQPFSLMPDSITIGTLVPPPNQNGSACGLPQQPGTASCQVICNWTLLKQ
jgi:hypothetical protein